MYKKLVVVFFLILFLIFATFICINRSFNSNLDELVINKDQSRSANNYQYDSLSNGIKISFDKFSGVVSLLEFTVTESSEISIAYTSNMESDNAYFYVLDSNHNIICKLDINKTSSNTFSAKKSKYYLKFASSKSHNGTAEFTITSNSEVNIESSGFWKN